MEFVIGEELPPVLVLEDALQNGVYLCKLGMALLPHDELWRKVYDLDQSKFKVCSTLYVYWLWFLQNHTNYYIPI